MVISIDVAMLCQARQHTAYPPRLQRTLRPGGKKGSASGARLKYHTKYCAVTTCSQNTGQIHIRTARECVTHLGMYEDGLLAEPAAHTTRSVDYSWPTYHAMRTAGQQELLIYSDMGSPGIEIRVGWGLEHGLKSVGELETGLE